MNRPALLRVVAVLGLLLVAWLLASPASAAPGFADCKEAPTPEVPGTGMAGFFSAQPDTPPESADPFAKGADTTIFEQYGYAGLSWHTYDLGCGPDAMRHPDAVIGTSISNWMVQLPIALTALTGSLTQAAFAPDFLGGLDGAVEDVSTALHENLFVSWIPFVIAAVGVLIIFKARKASLATTAAAVGWALIVVLMATALFRWPVAAGHAADGTVTNTLGTVVSKLDGNSGDIDPGTAVASNVHESILYKAWLAGTFGSPDSATAQKYGPELFKAQALNWEEAQILEQDPERGEQIIERKQDDWEDVAHQVQDEDPAAYEYLTGTRSETRLGYAVLSTLGAFLALPFLIVSALLLIGCFLIVRLAVMLFPAFATLGAFPSARGLVIGLGRTVGAAVVNAIIFGVGAGVTVAVLGILFHPGSGAPAWLGLVLMPLFSLIMWVAMRPFRRLTTMVSPDDQHFGRFDKPTWIKRAAVAGLSAVTSGAAAGVAAGAVVDDEDESKKKAPAPPERHEARPSYDGVPTYNGRPALSPSGAGTPQDQPAPRPTPDAPLPAGGQRRSAQPPSPEPPAPEIGSGFVPRPSDDTLQPAESEEFDGEEVYAIYRPTDDEAPAST